MFLVSGHLSFVAFVCDSPIGDLFESRDFLNPLLASRLSSQFVPSAVNSLEEYLRALEQDAIKGLGGDDEPSRYTSFEARELYRIAKDTLKAAKR